MKKVKYLIISLISIFTFNINVFAASGSLGVSSSSVYVGDSFTVTANVSSAAAWNIHVSASGPVSGCSINQADATADAMDTNKTFSATCTATGTGTITITLSGDVTSASDGNAVNVSGSRSVTVSTRPTPPSNNNNNNNNNNSNNSNNSNSNNSNNNTQATDNRSKNNNIKELSVEGYDLTKVDNNNYTLSVPNDVTSINIKASAEDSKSKVTGAGAHDINVGENNIEVVVTAENESQNKINIKVTRKDAYYLEDLDSALSNPTTNNIIINADSILSSQDLSKVKSSKRTINFNYHDENKKMLYSWSLDGSKMKDFQELVTGIDFKSNNSKEISKLSNYADGLYFSMKHTESLPAGTKIKIYVGNKYSNGDIVNVYYYDNNNNKLESVKEGLTVKDGYVEFESEKGSDYFVTMSTIPSSDKVVTTTGNSSSPILLVIIGILSLLVISLVVAFIVKNKKNKKNDNNNNNSGNGTVTNEYENLTTDINTVDTISSSQEVSKSYSSFNTTNENNTTSNVDYDNSSNYNNQSSNNNSNFF